MSRLIDADALMKDLEKWLKQVDPTHPQEDNAIPPMEDIIVSTLMTIEEQPTIEERKTGKWAWDENGMDWNLGAWVCSECHARNDNIPPAIKYNDGYRKVGNPYMWEGSKFCPNCGARMVQEGEDNDRA